MLKHDLGVIKRPPRVATDAPSHCCSSRARCRILRGKARASESPARILLHPDEAGVGERVQTTWSRGSADVIVTATGGEGQKKMSGSVRLLGNQRVAHLLHLHHLSASGLEEGRGGEPVTEAAEPRVIVSGEGTRGTPTGPFRGKYSP